MREEVQGTFVVGSGLALEVGRLTPRFVVAPGGRLTIGDQVRVSSGVVISASEAVSIGHRVQLGVEAFVMDTDFFPDDSVPGVQPTGAVIIEDDVVIGPRAVIGRGVRVGQGALIDAGALVVEDVAPFTRVAGNPARVLSRTAVTPPRALLLSADRRTLAGALSASIERAPQKAAVRCGAETLTYAELGDRVEALAHRLIAAGITPGEAVVVLCEGKAAQLVGFYGVLAARGVAVPLGEGTALASTREVAERTHARVVVVDSEAGLAMARSAGASPVRAVGPAPGTSKPSVPSAAPGDRAVVMFTSGTTSKRKGVVLTHVNLMQATENITAFMRLDETITEYVSIPLTHSFGMGRVRCVLGVGGALVLHDGPLNPALMIRAMETSHCNALSVVPAGLALFAGPAQALLERIGSALRWVELGSAFLSSSGKLRLCELFPLARVCMHYGLTEASRSTFLEFHSERDRLDTVGRASPNVEVIIADPDGHPVAPGVAGEIVVKGAHVASGYLDDPELTGRAFQPEQRMRTGDFGFLDERGYLTLQGRKDEMINSGGIKVSPLELEEKLRTAYPTVEMSVVGCQDPSGLVGQIVVVAHAQDLELGVPQLTAALADLVDRTKLPRAVVRVPSLPKTENGKVKKQELRAMCEELLTKGEGK